MKNRNSYRDKLLVFKALHGNGEAYGSLFDIYSKDIYRFIYFRVSNSELAEDLTSQTFLKVWEYLSQGKNIKSFRSFLYQTARNLVIDYYRSREKEELPLIYLSEEIEAEIKINPDKEIDSQTLKKIVDNLNGEQKEIVTMRFIEELSVKEISKIVDKSTNHIRVIIHRAIKDLRKYIK